MRKPILSVVIANYNYGRFLESCIKSFISQFSDADKDLRLKVELLVIDGLSTDNSVEIIKKYSEHIDYWVSEKDNGQSDAFNKGFAKASGKYLTWLNADDMLTPSCIRRVVRAMENHPSCDWFTANMFRFLEDGRIVEVGWGPHYFPKSLQSKRSLKSMSVYGPSTFFSKKVFQALGGIDETLVNTMDNDLWIRFVMAGIKQRRINTFVWAFRMHEASKSAEFGAHLVSKERREMITREGERIFAKTGFSPLAFWNWIVLAWRIIDGSLVRALWLRRSMRSVEGVLKDWKTKA